MGEILELHDGSKYTLQELKEVVESRERHEELRKLKHSWRTINFLEQNRDVGRRYDETVETLVKGFFDANSGIYDHVSYWNSAFYVANRFNLDEFRKRRSGVVAVWNGRHSYFGWINHHTDFDNAGLFANMGIITPEEADRFRGEYERDTKYYQFIPENVEQRLMKHLRLTESEVECAYLLTKSILDKLRTNNKGSGQHSGLPTRPSGH